MKTGNQVQCIAVIGPDNTPILVQKYCEENQEFEIDTLLFCSLDYFDRQLPQARPMPRLSGGSNFLGNVQTSDRFQIWGYRAPLSYKIVILTSHLSNPQDGPVKALCENVKTVLFDCMMDPFYTPFSVIEARNVLARINLLAERFQVTAA
jgi:hypothetical protein